MPHVVVDRNQFHGINRIHDRTVANPSVTGARDCKSSSRESEKKWRGSPSSREINLAKPRRFLRHYVAGVTEKKGAGARAGIGLAVLKGPKIAEIAVVPRRVRVYNNERKPRRALFPPGGAPRGSLTARPESDRKDAADHIGAR